MHFSERLLIPSALSRPARVRMPGSSLPDPRDKRQKTLGEMFHRTHPSPLSGSSRPRKRSRPLPSFDTPIEISSDEEETASISPAKTAELRSQLSQMERELAKAREERDQAKAAVEDIVSNKFVLDPSDMKDLDCEVCTNRIYTPYLFLDVNPEWDAERTAERLREIVTPQNLAHSAIARLLLAWQEDQPEYNCPTCRKRVCQRPIEVYSLKSLVRTILAANKVEQALVPPDPPILESSPSSNRWQGFFPL
ncbi:hypothetical protein Agabi119p4_3273 [Agaricus bisporus var. burnettii]|uniref:Uncharacterized protein n=1 Tax=Agaricus bisporus var. burnettii TaxID=192524 RepID=A0A8H7C2R7_AGABI|nr:hypothetical protein Agabi119p4_10362 [Agaricus bisporus var. burnettii]KAF7778928.1 hypothetical protein Agabi119p4_3273 [Agaricus bisporus var. burnettii]